VVILDDGFQHRALSREMDIVMIDAANRLPDIPMLPAGLRREPLGALRRASLVVFSNVSGAADDDWLGRYTSVPVARVRTAPLGVRRLHEESPGPVTGLAGKRCLAFCGIGNPEAFRATAERAGLRVAAMKVFRDHVWYGPEELRQVQAAFAGSGAELLLTTEKDAVKLAAAGWAELPVYVLAAGLEFLSGGDVLDEGLRKLMSRQTP
jgi:tetraacyldisaccharide 4'-kinase